MNKSHGYKHTKFICPSCGHEVKKEVGKKKFFGIRLYEHQKATADKRGGVQFVVDNALEDEE
jgi:hypothetical protein